MTVFVASALMGAGKTRGFIENIDPELNYILAVPTIELGKDIVASMNEAGVEYEVINSDENWKGSTKSRISRALTEGREGCVLVITHKALTMMETDGYLSYYLSEWTIIVDEVPNLNNCAQSRKIPFSTYDKLFKGLVQDHDDGRVAIAEGVPEYMLLDELKKSITAGIEPAKIMFSGLLEQMAGINRKKSKSEVQLVKGEDHYVVTVADYHDYTKIIDWCKEFHVMGNGVEKTLFYQYVVAQGYDIKESRFTPGPFKYKASVTLVPLFNTDRISKSKMELMDDGTKAKRFDETCLGWKAMKKAIEYHQNEKVLVQCFKWMKGKNRFPFDDYKNVIVTPFDSRGVNKYRNDYHRTVNVFHGNPDPIQARLETKMLAMMGIDIDEGRAAIEHERFIEPMAQHIARTSIRNGIEQEEGIVVVLPTVDVAKRIEEVLQVECEIDTSIMLNIPERAPSKVKLKKAERDQKMIELHSEGRTHKEIGEALGGVSTKTVQRALKKAA
ncbi:hypothetical protein [Franzmannia qiaohouensis]|uniref:Uncharacterized protein n=1 Tax=Franzmannia qiaohouensis TaxID=1329370 RepID=A0ABU1HBN6_9GAMM|nr:hypothetical protein [Halomonas qiaohouensis]MDR5904873.1 hypothetical protein [Halomonas qiaohouensis]